MAVINFVSFKVYLLLILGGNRNTILRPAHSRPAWASQGYLGHGHEPVEGVGGVHPEGGQLHHLLLFHHREGQPSGENGAGSDELGILRDIALKYFCFFSKAGGKW